MSLTILKAGEGGGDFAPAPEGTHVAVCTAIIDLGTQPPRGGGKFADTVPKHEVLIRWELAGCDVNIGGEMLPAIVQRRYKTARLHEKSTLRKHLDAWRGRKFTPEELEVFDIKNVLGKGCMLNVVHSPDGRYANVEGVMSLPKGVAAPKPHGATLSYEIEMGTGGTWGELSKGLQKAVLASMEAANWSNAGKAETDANAGEETPDFQDDDIPF